MKKLKIAALLLVSAFLLSACSAAAMSQNTISGTTDSKNANSQKKITIEEIAQHSSASDCWMAIEGKVYNVTNYVRIHPGGSSIIRGCGKDATSLYNNRNGSGRGHSALANRILQTFQIGTLSQ